MIQSGSALPIISLASLRSVLRQKFQGVPSGFSERKSNEWRPSMFRFLLDIKLWSNMEVP